MGSGVRCWKRRKNRNVFVLCLHSLKAPGSDFESEQGTEKKSKTERIRLQKDFESIEWFLIKFLRYNINSINNQQRKEATEFVDGAVTNNYELIISAKSIQKKHTKKILLSNLFYSIFILFSAITFLFSLCHQSFFSPHWE